MRKISAPYLVSICSYPNEAKNGLDRYLLSLNNLSLNSFELILIGFQPLDNIPSIPIPNIRMYNLGEPYPGNLHRFDFLYEPVTTEMDESRWIIFTDTYDVVFQKDFPNFSVFNDNEVLVANEGEKWSDSSWWSSVQGQMPSDFMGRLGDRMILNAGTWAMNVKTFKTMYRFMAGRARDYNNAQWSDQPMYNEFIYSGVVKPLEHPTFCTTLYKNMELGNVVKKDNKFYNRNDELYSIVHGNGSAKSYFEEGDNQ